MQMEAQSDHSVDEIRRLQRCINDLASLVALPAVWSGGESSDVVCTLLNVLPGMLRLDLVYVRLRGRPSEAPIEMARVARSWSQAAEPGEIGAMLDGWLGSDSQNWAPLVRNIGDENISLVPLPLGLQGEIGVIVAGARRAGFPGQTERLVLSVAANQAAISLHEAQLLGEQRRLASMLDQRVAQRTKDLAAVNEKLRREIVGRRRVEEDLRRGEAFLTEAQRLSLIGSFCWRVTTGEITWSEQLYRIFGFEPGTRVTLELIGTRVHPEDAPAVQDMIQRAQNGGGPFEFEHRLLMPDRSVKYVHLIAHEATDEGGSREYIGAAQDVTRRRSSEEALAKARTELAHVARVTSLGVLTASIAHEINQPLASMMTNAESSLRWLAHAEPNVEKIRVLTGRVVADARRASEIISRIREMATGRAPSYMLLSLNDIVAQSIAFLRHEFRSKGASVSLDLAPALPQVSGDRTQLQQVIVSLVLNALQAMEPAAPPRTIAIRTALSDAEIVDCVVEDSGPGIDPAHLLRIFDSFFTTKDAGMGMGLPICRSIIEAHAGHILADNESALGGARFSFALPGASSLGGLR
jgi:signal transduction histidine kinase